MKKHEKDYSLTFGKDNKFREIIISDDMTWNVIMKKYNDIDNSECSICYNNKTFMFKCKYCAFVLAPLELQAEKVLFFRCKSDFFHVKTTFFSKHVGKKVIKNGAFVKCGTFCCNVEILDF